MLKNTTHTNQENGALLIFNFDVIFWIYDIVTLEAYNPLLLISIALQLFRLYLSRDWNLNTYLNFEIQKLLKAVGNC